MAEHRALQATSEIQKFECPVVASNYGEANRLIACYGWRHCERFCNICESQEESAVWPPLDFSTTDKENGGAEKLWSIRFEFCRYFTMSCVRLRGKIRAASVGQS
jgi:hypothetical protein